jgi:hypothetical protein
VRAAADAAHLEADAASRPPAPCLDAFAERAAIAEHDGGMTRADAEALAAAEQGYPTAAALLAAVQEAAR